MSQQFPTTEEEWWTHVLNIHGTPFEQLCEYHLRQSPDWTFRSSRYPVEFPPSYTPQVLQTKTSELDLWGICRSSGLTTELLVECKKNNPEFIDWIFFPARHPTLPSLRTLGYHSSQEVGGHWAPYRETVYLVTPLGIAITDDGRETKGNYQAKWEQSQKNGRQLPKGFTKTSNAAITDAAYQIALATQALLHQERRNQEALAAGKVYPMPNYSNVFLPLIVTTANLWTCQFPAEQVNSITGEIPFSEVQYETHPYLFYTYALPVLATYDIRRPNC